MKNTHTAPLEVLSSKANGTFATEPFEAGWADEALAMIYVREVMGPSPKLSIQAQVSVDGSRWMNHHSESIGIDGPGAYYLELDNFGNWLRVTGEVSGGPADSGAALVLDFYWVLKG